MAAQQILVLFVLVRIQVEQRKAVSNVRWSGFSVFIPLEKSGLTVGFIFHGHENGDLTLDFTFHGREFSNLLQVLTFHDREKQKLSLGGAFQGHENDFLAR